MRRRDETRPPGYFELELLSGLERDGCPVCRFCERSDREYFFGFFHDSYMERAVLDRLTDSLGFCLSHAAYLIRGGEGRSQLAVVHRILARRLRARWLGRRSRGLWKSAAAWAGNTGDCPACQSHERRIRGAALFLAKLMEDPATAGCYANPGALCLPHLQVIAPGLADATLERVLALHETMLASAGEGLGGSPNGAGGFPDAAAAKALHLAVGHDRGTGPLPSPDPGVAARSRLDPAQTLAEDMAVAEACPVCLEVRRAWLEWIAWLDSASGQGETVEDVLPTCADHVWATMHVGGPALRRATVERVCRMTLDRFRLSRKVFHQEPPAPGIRKPVQAILGAVQGRRPFVRAARIALASEIRCPVCVRLATARDRAITLLFALLEERGHRDRFEGGYGLCLGHFARALALGPAPPVRTFMTGVEAAKLGRLEWELEEYSRKSAWQARPEGKGTEQAAVHRALRRFSGSLDPCPGDGRRAGD